MKLSKSMINLLLLLAGVAIGLCSWLYIATPNLDKAQALETEPKDVSSGSKCLLTSGKKLKSQFLHL